MPDTINLKLKLTTDPSIKFKDWRELMNGEGAEETKSNMQILDDFSIKVKTDFENVENTISMLDASIQASLGEVRTIAETARSISEGKTKAIVFQTKEEMNLWLAISNNISNLKIGDVFFIVDKNVSDYWWDGLRIQELETEKINFNLEDYFTKSEINQMLDNKQNILVSGESLKTINGVSLLGSGDLKIGGGGAGGFTWGIDNEISSSKLSWEVK